MAYDISVLEYTYVRMYYMYRVEHFAIAIAVFFVLLASFAVPKKGIILYG